MSAAVVYTREGCHLCEDLLEDLATLAAQHAFGFIERDVDGDPVLRARYGERVPVVEVDGEVVCEYFLDPSTLLDRIKAGR